MTLPVKSIVLFGSGSPIIVDFEETCARLGIALAAIVRNIPCTDCMMDATKLVTVADMPPMLYELPFAVPLFTPANRRSGVQHARAGGARSFAALIDPTAVLPRGFAAGQGAFVNAGVVCGAQSSIGDFAFINRAATLGHHCRVGEYASVGPGVVAAASVLIEHDAMVGAGATIVPEIKIGHHAVVQAGSVVTRDVAPYCLVAGNPARLIKELDRAKARL